jgi:hypothetical protein
MLGQLGYQMLLEIANGLWEKSRVKTFPAAAQTSQQNALTHPPQAGPRQHTSKLPNERN